MDKKTTLDFFKEYFERQINKARLPEYKNKINASPFLTISRETGAGGLDYPQKLLSCLNAGISDKNKQWTLFDKNILEEVIADHDLPKELSKFMPEKRISDLQTVIEQFFGLHPSEHNLVSKISHTIIHLANIGNVILVGRGSNIITSKLSKGIHIRLIDSVSERIKNVQMYLKIDKVSAAKYIEREDNNKKEYIKKYFNKDISNPHIYTLVINFAMIEFDLSFKLVEKCIRNL